MFVDYATAPKSDFMQRLDLGVPIDEPMEGAEDVLIFYSSSESLPTSVRREGKRSLQSAEEATKNCQTVRVVLLQPPARKEKPQCFAIVPQWSSPYIYKFMRVPPVKDRGYETEPIDRTLPLRYVPRSQKEDGGNKVSIPNFERSTLPHLKQLAEYATEYENVRIRLKDLLKDAYNHQDIPLIVMVCNFGQSDLLVNFVCSANARNLDLSRLILFATDIDTYQLCQDLHIPFCYHDPILFGDIPDQAAGRFADKTFGKVMKAKVYSVHLILSLGFSVLFQDVDVVWLKYPLQFLQNITGEGKWDMVFQRDGNTNIYYAPYSPNSGFYFVHWSPKTLYLFGELLKMGDTISTFRSHQQPLSQLLNEHISWTGIRVKVYQSGFDNPFPGGFEYNLRLEYMKDLLITKETGQDPYIFHMYWTESKVNTFFLVSLCF